ERQQLKLMDTLAAIVGTLDQREICQSVISHTGRRHAEFGVQTSHFVAFGDALIWGLQRQFGPAFTPEMQQAWIVLYDAIQAEMMRAEKTRYRNRPALLPPLRGLGGADTMALSAGADMSAKAFWRSDRRSMPRRSTLRDAACSASKARHDRSPP